MTMTLGYICLFTSVPALILSKFITQRDSFLAPASEFLDVIFSLSLLLPHWESHHTSSSSDFRNTDSTSGQNFHPNSLSQLLPAQQFSVPWRLISSALPSSAAASTFSGFSELGTPFQRLHFFLPISLLLPSHLLSPAAFCFKLSLLPGTMSPLLCCPGITWENTSLTVCSQVAECTQIEKNNCCAYWQLYSGSYEQFSHSVMSSSLWSHGLQLTRLPCPSSTPRACSNSCPLSRWCHPTISSSVVPFSSCLKSFPASGSFPVSQFFTSGFQSIGVCFSFSISPSNEYSGLISFRIDWFVLLAVQGTLESLLQHHNLKASVLRCSAFFMCSTLTSIHDYWKNHSFD